MSYHSGPLDADNWVVPRLAVGWLEEPNPFATGEAPALDTETFAFFNCQYILYGMGYRTDMSAARDDFTQVAEAEKLFAKSRRFGDRAPVDPPTYRSPVQQINAAQPARAAA